MDPDQLASSDDEASCSGSTVISKKENLGSAGQGLRQNSPENRSFRNRENLQYLKTADLVSLRLFMNINGLERATTLMPLKQHSAFCQNQIFLKDQNMKIVFPKSGV